MVHFTKIHKNRHNDDIRLNFRDRRPAQILAVKWNIGANCLRAVASHPLVRAPGMHFAHLRCAVDTRDPD
jgi:hypothetical protein